MLQSTGPSGDWCAQQRETQPLRPARSACRRSRRQAGCSFASLFEAVDTKGRSHRGRTPNMNAFAERFVGTLRRECSTISSCLARAIFCASSRSTPLLHESRHTRLGQEQPLLECPS